MENYKYNSTAVKWLIHQILEKQNFGGNRLHNNYYNEVFKSE